MAPALLLLLLSFETDVAEWRKDREARLKADDGWLTLVGLTWLKAGPNAAPKSAGVFTLRDKAVEFAPAAGADVRFNGKPLSRPAIVKPNSADVIEAAGLKMLLIDRGGKLGVRIKDNASEYRRNFKGLRWFAPRRDWLIEAKFIPYPQARKMLFDAQAGDPQPMTSPGYVEFTHAGRPLRLTPVNEDGRLFFIFRDKTAGKTTYPAARFLYADPPKNGRVTLDFNKAYNPPCVFTPYATCPLPPPENRLPVAVEAGERMYEGAH